MAKIRRTGQEALEFEGQEIASASSRETVGKQHKRWHEVKVYRTKDGRFAVAVSYRSECPDEPGCDDAFVVANAQEVAHYLERFFFLSAASIRYRLSQLQGQKHAMAVLADLRNGCEEIVSGIREKIGAAERIE